MKFKNNQLDEEVSKKKVKMQQLKTENDKLYRHLDRRHQEATNVNKISVGCQTRKVSIM